MLSTGTCGIVDYAGVPVIGSAGYRAYGGIGRIWHRPNLAWAEFGMGRIWHAEFGVGRIRRLPYTPPDWDEITRIG